MQLSRGTGTYDEQLRRLKTEIATADAIVIGAGAGLSTSAGFTYSGQRFELWFHDFALRYGFRDMYSGGFTDFGSDEVFWAYWARYIYINRYMDAPKPVYNDLLNLVKDKDFFVITTNVDHQFQRAGIDKSRLFYTQGDYGLFQSTDPSIRRTFENEAWVMKAMEAQGYVRDRSGIFREPEDGKLSMRIPSDLVPKCPVDGGKVVMNLRSDDSFVEDDGWRKASESYSDFLYDHRDGHVLYLELGVGSNTPVIIKYPFWQMTASNPKAVYACINYSEAYSIRQIERQSICIDGDIGEVLNNLRRIL
ncbi:MAG: Sir2 silent information regulator family NAD-dependent deacetylase [Sphaerochaetaceae bacterium]|nr:Sir2 silent information regulator family NAD-dependent deacetylase [Sphaerochaetaceae bacterium]